MTSYPASSAVVVRKEARALFPIMRMDGFFFVGVDKGVKARRRGVFECIGSIQPAKGDYRE